MKKDFRRLVCIVTMLFTILSINGQITTQWGPDGFVKIENGLAGLNSNIASGDIFGQDHDQVGDINGDGVIDLVVGSRTADDGGIDNGAVHILFMNNDGTVQSNQKISMLEGGFTAILTQGNNFGYGVAGIGDYDNDGIPDIAVAAPLTADQAIYIIHLNANGTVKSYVKNENIACLGITAVGDLNNDGRIDLVACDPSSDLDGTNIGAIRILFFDATSNIIQTKLINPSNGGFGTGLVAGDQFGGREVAMLGDIDNDGTKEMAVGAFRSDGGKGAIWMLSLDTTTLDVVSKLKISEGLNGFSETLSAATNPNGSDGAQFGHALCRVGDLNGDGIPDLMTGANQQSEGYILYLNADKTVKTFTRINNDDGGFGLVLQSNERFARSISFVGDLRGDGTIAVTYGGGAGSTAGGTLYLLFFKPCDFTQEAGFNHWSGGNILFSNWDHPSQMLTSDSLTVEQCTFKAFETDAKYMTYNFNDGRCICVDSTAVLASSTELSTAFSNKCYSGLLATNIIEFNIENQTIIYPNPTNSELILKTSQTSFSERDRIQLFSIIGEQFYASGINSQKTTIDLSAFPQGIYIVTTSINGVQKSFKILKE
ncbi:MAG: FG-GAP-like repeat-containing protein [Bacteroidia bacterium]